VHPKLFEFGPLSISSYGVMLALSFFAGVYYVYLYAKKHNLTLSPFLATAYIMVFAGILGARVAYVLFHLEEFTGNWFAVINPYQGAQFGITGLSLYGGIIGAVVFSIVYLKWRGYSVLDTFDIFAPTIGIGLFFTRIGCFLNGCCFGTPTDLPWGVSFPAGSIPWYIFGTQDLHPAQIYSSLYGLGLFFFLHWRLKNRVFTGQVLGLMFMIEALFRHAIEYVRFYEPEMYINLFGLNPTYNHIISVILFAAGFAIYVTQYKKYLKSSAGFAHES